MARFWVRHQGTQSGTSANTLSTANSMYQNSREVQGNITLVQKATVVATVLWAISDTDDTWSMTLLVHDEGRTVTYADPSIDAVGSSDPEVKGQFIFARGPLLYTPKRLIAIPSESEFTIRISKEQGGNASVLNWHVMALVNTSL